MRHILLTSICAVGFLGLSACSKSNEAEVERAVQDVLSTDEAQLNEIMMSAADSDEAVAYFRKTEKAHPDQIGPKRGLAEALTRAHRNTEAVAAWEKVAYDRASTNADRVAYAEALIRVGDWKKAEAVLDDIPPTYETFDRYKLEAMIADSKKEWKKADSYYETAVDLTTQPSGVLNNWGFSKMTRGDYRGAERLFVESITYDPRLFAAKNNLALARGAQRNYEMPVIDMTQDERAHLYYTLALAAIKQGDVSIGKGLLQDAIDTSPQHFEEATRALNALEARG
jgi:Flp pilus assembly protein TadD